MTVENNIALKAFYYLRYDDEEDGGTHPYACVCLVKTNDGDIARGVAVCSSQDQFSKRKARNISYGYAVKALSCDKGNAQCERRGDYADSVTLEIASRDNKFCDDDIVFNGTYPQYSLLAVKGIPLSEHMIEISDGIDHTPSIPMTSFERSVLEG